MQIGTSTLPGQKPDAGNVDPGAQTSGPAFDRLIAAAQKEADRRKAIAATTGATADTFSDQGWFQAVKAHGAEIGLGVYAGQITKDARGQYNVLDAAARAKVLSYRNDPLVRSIMAVKRQADSKAVLNIELGRPASDAELKVSDAIGPKAAASLITTRQSTPNASAAIVTPDAAKANWKLFYRPDGSPQTVNEVLVALMKPTDQPVASPPATVAPVSTAKPGQPAVAAAPRTGSTPQTLASPQLGAPPVPNTQGMTPELAAALKARTVFASSATTTPVAQPHKAAPAPPDLPLVSGTIGQLSMPGSARGPVAPTGGKITGWRAQLAGEVTSQIEHPESVVQNLPSNVTIPAPGVGQTRAPVSAPLAVAVASADPVPGQLGASFVPSNSAPLPTQTLAAPQAMAPAPLPALVTAPPVEQTTALPLVSIGDSLAPMAPQPKSMVAAPSTVAASLPTAVEATPSVVARPSRYGPGAAQSMTMPLTQFTSLPATPGSMAYATVQGGPDASSAGIRPSRYYASSALAAQQFASLQRVPQQPVPGQTPYPSSAVTLGPAQSTAPQSIGPQSTDPIRVNYSAAPVTIAAVGPDGVPILPPVPGQQGLPPISAGEALRPFPSGDVLQGTKPLDLAPAQVAQSEPQAVGPRPVQAARPRVPRTIPGRF